VGVEDFADVLFEASELDELLLEVLKLRVGRVELLELLIDLVLPEPAELVEALKELVDVVLGTLNGTSQKKDDLDDLLVLGNPVVEGLPFVLGQVLLIPVLDVLG
jgi:hypothetical protein